MGKAPVGSRRLESVLGVDSCNHLQGVLWRGLFGDMAETHDVDKQVEIHSSGEDCWTGRDALLGQRLLDWPRYTTRARIGGLAEKRYGIPNEYSLHAPSPRQRLYDAYPGGFSISVDALEAALSSRPSNGKEQVGPTGETQAPRPHRPRSVKELHRTSAGEEDVDYYTLRMIDLPLIAVVDQHASESQALADHMKVELEEADWCRASLEMERENYRLDLVDS
ncbi:hypothetical protein B296_00015442 [Ensete ventricosum]|uniref:Uncharacterized protein n=1 Tax=Ensete ventricosum TaxID=4639 RepID=A0A427B3S4_ENSVE|nr:hypothetical protein B296_00015442 [Ensete ventricosum]